MTGIGILTYRALAIPLAPSPDASQTPGATSTTEATATPGTAQTPRATQTPEAGEFLTYPEVVQVAGVMVLAFVATGALVLAFRRGYIAVQPKLKDAAPNRQDLEGDTFVRSVLALWLVIGLMVITVVSFGLKDANLRSTLVGAVAASAGGAIAFYFSSKAASEARRDLLNVATDAQVEVPKIVGLTVAKARELFAEHATLGLNAGTFGADQRVAAQSPLPGDRVPRGTLVTIDKVTPTGQTEATKPEPTKPEPTKPEPTKPEPTKPKPPAPTQAGGDGQSRGEAPGGVQPPASAPAATAPAGTEASEAPGAGETD